MRRSLLITLLALMLTGAAFASQSVTCTAAPIAPRLSCFLESPSMTLGAFELTTGAYATIDPHEQSVVSFAPFLTIAEYQPTWAWWLELRLPKVDGVPAVFGITDPVRLGFTVRW